MDSPFAESGTYMREGGVRAGVDVGLPERRLDAPADQRVAAVEALRGRFTTSRSVWDDAAP
jgi:hypothetical protein